MPLLPADFIHARGCKPICAKLLTLPTEIFCPGQQLLVHNPHLLNEEILLLLDDRDIEQLLFHFPHSFN